MVVVGAGATCGGGVDRSRFRFRFRVAVEDGSGGLVRFGLLCLVLGF